MVLVKRAVNVLEQCLVSGGTLNLLDFDFSQLIFDLLCFHFVDDLLVLCSLLDLLLKQHSLSVDSGILVLKLLNPAEEVHLLI